jgi:4-hydroxy-2-oxoheptanedioate aldolase
MTKQGGTVGGLGRLKAGERLVAAWSGIADPLVAELLVREGFDTAVLDMQHGAYTVETAFRGIGALALAGAPAIVRIPIGDFATASRLLDGGAAAVIAPMVNSVADAKAFASYMRFPPGGDRSWGPHRALALSGLDAATYLAEANGLQLAIPMIETREAMAALDDILAVPGIDGVFVGPSDLSIALSRGRVDPASAEVDRALDHVAARARAAGKFAGLFCFSGAQAKAMGARGFGLCSIATDSLMLRAAAKAELAAARG